MTKRKATKKSYRRNPLNITAGGVGMIAVAAVAGFGLFLLWRWMKKNPGALNPASTNNVVYGGANRIVQAVTGDPTASVGTKIADWFKPAAQKQVDIMMSNSGTGPAKSSASSTPLTTESAPLYGMQDADGVEDVLSENVSIFRRR